MRHPVHDGGSWGDVRLNHPHETKQRVMSDLHHLWPVFGLRESHGSGTPDSKRKKTDDWSITGVVIVLTRSTAGGCRIWSRPRKARLFSTQNEDKCPKEVRRPNLSQASVAVSNHHKNTGAVHCRCGHRRTHQGLPALARQWTISGTVGGHLARNRRVRTRK